MMIKWDLRILKTTRIWFLDKFMCIPQRYFKYLMQKKTITLHFAVYMLNLKRVHSLCVCKFWFENFGQMRNRGLGAVNTLLTS